MARMDIDHGDDDDLDDSEGDAFRSIRCIKAIVFRARRKPAIKKPQNVYSAVFLCQAF